MGLGLVAEMLFTSSILRLNEFREWRDDRGESVPTTRLEAYSV